MKLKNFYLLLGLRNKAKRYLYKVVNYDIGNGRSVHYAQWKHPGETTKVISSDLIQEYSKYIREGDFCIDIGAHTGDTALPMSVAAGKSGCVLAIEPNPYVYHVLEKNARANTHVGNIKTMLAAATENEGFTKFEYSDSGFCNGGLHKNISSIRHGNFYSLEVFGVNLENELKNDFANYLPRLKFIKVDAESYDLYVLKSIKNILIEYLPIVKTEIFKKTDTQYRTELLLFFINLGYFVYKIELEPMKIGEELTKENLEVGKHFDILCVPDKIKIKLIGF